MPRFDLSAMTDWQEQLYEHLHAHPELSMREHETLTLITDRLAALGYETVQVGGGVVGVLRNGDGPVVLARADFDALPVTELAPTWADAPVPYASTVTATDATGATVGVMHACGHDVHVTCALGAARYLADHHDAWHGTYLALFQPGEETAEGARSMVASGLVDAVPKPDVCLGQHVMGAEAGTVSIASGPVMATGDSIKVTLYGRGSHGSMPHLSVDPVVLAAAVVMRLQTIIGRTLAPGTFGVVTVGSMHVGNKANIIADKAVLELNVRSYDDETRQLILDSIERIVRAECQASGSPREPELEFHDQFPPTRNDAETVERVRTALVAELGQDAVLVAERSTGSEDFSVVPDAFGVPYAFWTFGGFPVDALGAGNHSPHFVPIKQPTLETGTRSLLAAVLAYVGGKAA